MPRRKLGDQLKTFMREKAAEASETTAKNIAYALKEAGPYWTGSFEQSWEVESGQTTIKPIYDPLPATPQPLRREISPVTIPRENRRRPKGYTIGNAAKHRDIAMDAPGTQRNAEGNTVNYVPRGWFNRFTQGGPMVRVAADSIKEVSRKSR